jgi:hypothetical protein
MKKIHHKDTKDSKERFNAGVAEVSQGAQRLFALPPSLLRSFGGLQLSPAEASAKALRAERAMSFLRPPRNLDGLCVKKTFVSFVSLW